MSGGYFDYLQFRLDDVLEKINELVVNNDNQNIDDYGDKYGRGYSLETLEKFDFALSTIRNAQAYIQRIDWLVSGDDSEESFHKRLAEELK